MNLTKIRREFNNYCEHCSPLQLASINNLIAESLLKKDRETLYTIRDGLTEVAKERSGNIPFILRCYEDFLSHQLDSLEED